MKHILIIGVILAGIIIFFVVKTSAQKNHYGDEITGCKIVTASELILNPSQYLGEVIIVEGLVKNQCRATGCYFFFLEGESKLRVELGDIAPKFPRREGHLAKVLGKLIKYGDSYQFLGSGVYFFDKQNDD